MGHATEVVTLTIYTHLFATDTARSVEAMAAGGRPVPTAKADDNVLPMRRAEGRGAPPV